MRFSGKNAKAARLASWFNRLIDDRLGNLINPGRGIRVSPSGEKGVTISTLAAVNQVFRLTQGKHQITSGFVTAKWATPGSAPAGGAVDQKVYFTYAPGWYSEDQYVVAQNILGQWEVMSPSCESHLEGELQGALSDFGDTDVLLPGPFIGTVSAKNVYNLTGADGDTVGIEWNPNRQQFVITAIKCPSHE